MEIDKIYNEDCLVGMRDIPDKSIDLIMSTVCDAIQEGLEERKVEKVDNKDAEEADGDQPKRHRARVHRKPAAKAENGEAAEATEEQAAEPEATKAE